MKTLLRDPEVARRHYNAENQLLGAALPTSLTLAEVAVEREHQERLHAAGKLPGAHCSDPKVSNASKLAVLVEEIGEVAKQINEGTLPAASRAHLRKELIQTAAVAVAWAESLTPGPEVSGQRSEVRRSA